MSSYVFFLSCFQVLSQCCESMPVFNNLKMLIITSDEGRGWQAMPALLRNCPQLEFLLIKVKLYFKKKNHEKCVELLNNINLIIFLYL